MADIGTVASLVGALGVGTIIGQWVAAGKDRRTARADALKALAEVEHTRWANLTDVSYAEFRQALRDFQTAALIARLPRSVVQTYRFLATACQDLSSDDVQAGPDSEFAGGIDGYLNELVIDVARLLTDVAWSSVGLRWLGRVRIRHKRLLSRVGQLRSETRGAIDAARAWPR